MWAAARAKLQRSTQFVVRSEVLISIAGLDRARGTSPAWAAQLRSVTDRGARSA